MGAGRRPGRPSGGEQAELLGGRIGHPFDSEQIVDSAISGSPTGRGLPRPRAHTGRVDLWFSRLVATGLVAVSLVEPGAHPARRGGLPRSARVVDDATAEVAETLLRQAAAAAAAAGVPLQVDLDEVLAHAARAAAPPAP